MILGFPDRGRRGVETNLADAREINHAMSIGIAQYLTLDVNQRLRDVAATAAEAARMQEFCIRYKLPFWLTRARMSAAWADGIANSASDAVAELQAGIAAWQATGAGVAMPQYHTMLGELLMHGGRLEEAPAARRLSRRNRSEPGGRVEVGAALRAGRYCPTTE